MGAWLGRRHRSVSGAGSVVDVPRQCVFAGTTNSDKYLNDETGARRFWPVKAGIINLVKLEKDRDQLWAEAYDMFKAGRVWWLDDAAMAQRAKEAQAERYIGDAWDEDIQRHVSIRSSVSIDEILTNVLHIEKGKWTQSDQNRVARSLRSQGFQRY